MGSYGKNDQDSERVRLTIYVDPDLKDKIQKLASTARPRTTASALGVHLLELGLKQYKPAA